MADPPAFSGDVLTRPPPVPEQFGGPRASQIMELPNTLWRDELVPASFNGATFHCEQVGIESGRRIVEHEYPKRDLPYSEDMGHRAFTWEIRGYIICYPFDMAGNQLYQRDYRNARDALMKELDAGGPFTLQVQTFPPFTMICERYRVSEQEKYGGFCTFDMTFREAGTVPFAATETRTSLLNTATTMRAMILQTLQPA
jgi:prophage DNA circulation protein